MGNRGAGPLLRRLADEWAPGAENRGLRLGLRVADPGCATVTDAMLLERVLRNLLSNAVWYTRAGGVLLACRTRIAADGTRLLRIEVWDSGAGIAEGQRERIFEEFFQLDNPARDRASGLGLGLGLDIVRGWRDCCNCASCCTRGPVMAASSCSKGWCRRAARLWPPTLHASICGVCAAPA